MKGRVEPDSRGSTPTQDNGHYPAVVTSNSSLPSLLTVNLKPQEPPPPGEGPPLIMPVPPGPPPPPPPPGAGPTGQTRMRCQSFDGASLQLLPVSVRGVVGWRAYSSEGVKMNAFQQGLDKTMCTFSANVAIDKSDKRTNGYKTRNVVNA